MKFTRPGVLGVKPVSRTWHSSVLLTGHRLMIHGGFDGASNEVLEDVFIFDIGNDNQSHSAQNHYHLNVCWNYVNFRQLFIAAFCLRWRLI